MTGEIPTHSVTLRLGIAFVVAGGILLFLGGPGDESPRSWQRVWDCGHIILFFLAALVWIRWVLHSRDRSDMWRWGEVLLGAALVGIAVEGLQHVLGRSPEWGDIFRDVLGSSLAVACCGFTRPSRLPWVRPAVRLALFVLLSVALVPLARALIDERAARASFPVLADFETAFEVDRWEGDVVATITKDVVRHGTGALKVPFSTARYSRISLKHFPGNWEGKTALRASVFNPGPGPLSLHLAISDAAYLELGQTYAQRFNRRFDLGSGWTELEVSVADIVNGPATRRLDLQMIKTVTFFTIDLAEPRTISLDQVELLRQ